MLKYKKSERKRNRLVKRSCVRSPSSTSSVKECIERSENNYI